MSRRLFLGALGTSTAGVALVAVGAPPAAAAPSLSGYPTLKYGSIGGSVRVLQRLLVAAAAPASVDGEFGPATRSAVTRFQEAVELSTDGVVGPQTWGALVPVLQFGAKGAAVKALQGALNDHGFTVAVDAEFGPATRAAVLAAQKKGGLEPDGSAGPVTWRYLVTGTGGTEPGRGAAVMVTQITGATEDFGNCGPASVVALQLALGHKPHGWTHSLEGSVSAVKDRAAVTHVREHVLRLPMKSTQGTAEVSTSAVASRINAGTAITGARPGHLAEALAAVGRGGVAMLSGGLKQAALWNDRPTGQTSHWVALLEHRAGQYLVCEPSSQHNRLVWISKAQVAEFARARDSTEALGNTSVSIG